MDDDHDPLDGESKRSVLRTIAAYRELCRTVARGSTGGLIFGALMLGIWYFMPDREKYGPFGLIYLGLAGLEFTAAAWNKFAPSAEGVLIDGLVLMAFGASNLVRIGLRVQAGGGQPNLFFGLFGVYMLYSGFRHVQSYRLLRRAFADRPSRDILRWFDGLVRETHAADPETNPEVLDLPSRPRMKVKFLDDTAIAVFPGSTAVAVAGREEVRLEAEPHADPDKLPKGYFLFAGGEYGPFPLHPENWKNYARWKAAGGSPPPPLAIRGFDR